MKKSALNRSGGDYNRKRGNFHPAESKGRLKTSNEVSQHPRGLGEPAGNASWFVVNPLRH
jgi:hypothetical protein